MLEVMFSEGSNINVESDVRLVYSPTCMLKVIYSIQFNMHVEGDL